MTTFGEKIVAKIEEDKVQLIPKWKFALHEWFVRGMCVVAVIIGSVAVSVTLTLMIDTDWSVYRQVKITFGQMVLLSVPYLWIAILVLFLGVAYYNWRHTRRGYRYRVLEVMGMSIGLSVVLGSVLYTLGLGAKIDQALEQNLPVYNQMMFHRQAMWSQPNQGLLAGTITKFSSKDSFELQDLQGRKWIIVGEDILWRGRVTTNVGEKIKVIGEMSGGNEFVAQEIRPWMGQGMMGGGRGRMIR